MDTCYTISEATHTKDEITEFRMDKSQAGEPTILTTEERESYLKELQQNELSL